MAITLPLRVNCAGAEYEDSETNIWLADQEYTGAAEWGFVNEAGVASYFYNTPIADTVDDTIYQYIKYQYLGDGSLTYSFDLPDGNYNITVKTVDTGPNRTEKVSFNGVLQDTIQLATATAKDFTFSNYTLTGSAGLDITFYNSSYLDAPQISGIYIEEVTTARQRLNIMQRDKNLNIMEGI